MNVVLLTLSFNEAVRLCKAAGWQIGGAAGPRALLVKDADIIDRIRGLEGSLCLISEGALRHGVPEEFVRRAAEQRMVIMCMTEPIQMMDSFVIHTQGIKL